MKAIVRILLGLMFVANPLFAQLRGVDITGKVVDKASRLPIEQASVRLLSVKDSSMVRGMASKTDGAFALKNVRSGSYILNITYIGFEPIYRNISVDGKKNPLGVGSLEMDGSGVHLTTAVITGKAPEVVVRNDTTEYNADSFKVTEGSMLEDLLKKMPCVEVDNDGNVTVNGKSISKIMVDGKEFFSDDPKIASKNLPAKMIDKVQVLD